MRTERPELAGSPLDSLGNIKNNAAAGVDFVTTMSKASQARLASQLFARAVSHHQMGQIAEAESAYRQVLNAKPDHVEALHLFGVLRFQQGRNDEALKLIGEALRAQPRYAEAHYNHGNILAQLGQYQEAVASYDKALAVMPASAEAHHNRGSALVALMRYEEAVASYDRAIALRHDYVDALDSRGSALRHLDRLEEALASHERALAISPRNACAHNNRGNALRLLKRHAEALQSYDRALACEPDFVDAVLNRGHALCELLRFDEALASYAKAQILRPDFAAAHLSEANCLLTIGDFERGWDKLEWRWETEDRKPFKRAFPQPLWLGREEISGRTILLHSEAGFGDTIHFCRYAGLLSDRGANVILEVQPPLKPLLMGLRGVQAVLARGERLPQFDYHCPMMSLPCAFGTRIDTIPSAAAYLRAPADRVEQWRARLPQSGGLRVGLAWASSAGSRWGGGNRWLAFQKLAALLSVDSVTFVSLHRARDLPADDAAALASSARILDFGREQPDFVDTAAIISSLDLVISVDSALGHLAGALGIPVWLMLPFLPEWRWLLARRDSPWYPSARLFRQPQLGDWDSVVVEVAQDVARMRAAGATQS